MGGAVTHNSKVSGFGECDVKPLAANIRHIAAAHHYNLAKASCLAAQTLYSLVKFTV